MTYLLSTPFNTLAASAEFSFSNNQINLQKGQRESVDIVLDTHKTEILGVDVLLVYDPKYIKINKVVDYGLFSNMPAKVIDNDNGKTSFSLTQSYGQYLQLNEAFVQLEIEAVETIDQKTLLSFVYQPNGTRDSNVVVQGGVDILGKVDTLTIDKNDDYQSVNAGSNGDSNNFELSQEDGLVVAETSEDDLQTVVNQASNPQSKSGLDEASFQNKSIKKPASFISPIPGHEEEKLNQNDGVILGAKDSSSFVASDLIGRVGIWMLPLVAFFILGIAWRRRFRLFTYQPES